MRFLFGLTLCATALGLMLGCGATQGAKNLTSSAKPNAVRM